MADELDYAMAEQFRLALLSAAGLPSDISVDDAEGALRTLRWLHAEAVFQRDEALSEVARWQCAWQGADREWAKDRAELQRERSSRQAWAAEAMRLEMELEHLSTAVPAYLKLLELAEAAVAGVAMDPAEDRELQTRVVDTLRAGRERVAGFTRPVCAVHLASVREDQP